MKDLKIRGTKFEPLALQLIMKGLNKGGRACVIVSNALLQSTSICAVETRKYLLQNFEVEKIIEISNNENVIYFKNGTVPMVWVCMLDVIIAAAMLLTFLPLCLFT